MTELKETKEVKDLIELQRMLEKQDALNENLLQYMKEDYPSLEKISVSDTSLSVSTSKFSMYLSIWSNEYKVLTEPDPKMSCDGNMKMPDTVDEFKQMKSTIESERQECIDVFIQLYPIFFPRQDKSLREYAEMESKAS